MWLLQDMVLATALGTRVCKVVTAGTVTKQRCKTLPRWPGGAVKCLLHGKSQSSPAMDVRKCSSLRGYCSADACSEIKAKHGVHIFTALRFTAGILSSVTRSSAFKQRMTEPFPAHVTSRDEMASDAVQTTVGACTHLRSPSVLPKRNEPLEQAY